MGGQKRRNRVWDVIGPLVFYLLLQIGVSMVVMIIAALVNPAIILEMLHDGSAAIGRLTMPIVIIANIVAVIVLWRSFRFDEMRFGPDRKRVHPGTLALAALTAAALADLIGAVLTLVGIDRIFPYYQETVIHVIHGTHPAIILISTILIAPIAEEFVFRGLVYRRARAYRGVKWGIFLSALLFGIFHLNMVQGIFAFLLGLFFAWMYERTQTLIVPIVCHAAANFWEIALEWLIARSGGIGMPARYMILVFEAAVALGGIFLLYRKSRCDTIQMLHK